MNRSDVKRFIHENFAGFTEEYPWERTPSYAVFRHQDNRKWFALLYDIEYSIIIKQNPQLLKQDGVAPDNPNIIVSALNLKSDPDLIEELTREVGILPAYHMNKRHWLTILLNNSCPDERIRFLINLSYQLTAKH